MLYDIIIFKTFYVVPLCYSECVTVTVTCDITFCLLCLCLNKEKEKKNKIKPSTSFTTLTRLVLEVYRPFFIVYKIDYYVVETLLSSVFFFNSTIYYTGHGGRLW